MQTKHLLCLSGFSEVVLDEEKVPLLEGQPAPLPPQPQNQLDTEEGKKKKKLLNLLYFPFYINSRWAMVTHISQSM